jgi:hypothetical protein
MKFTRTLCLLTASAALLCAQVNKTKIVEDATVFGEAAAPTAPPLPPPPGTAAVATTASTDFVYFRSDLKPVKAAPYAAESQTETIQSLADGNRIVRKWTSKTYRDSEGRTRTDNTVNALGPWNPDSQTLSISSIYDPSTGESFSLNHQAKTAMKASHRMTMATPASPMKGEMGATEMRVERKMTAVGGTIATETISGMAMPAAGMATTFSGGSGEMMMMHVTADGPSETSTQKETLGTKSIEGVVCEGSRITETIPANTIGNEKPIQIVTERWYSPELKVEVLRTHNDPRFGETNFKLSNIIRAEQPKNLFEIPSDYQLEEGARMPMKVNFQKK